MSGMNTLRMSKSFALRAMGAAAVYKALQSMDSEHVFSSDGIVRNIGEIASVGALCFNAAMSRYSQPHVVHAMKEVASGRVTLTTGQWVVSLLRGAGGQAGCLALFSYGTMRGCLALSDIALLSECGPLALLANLPGNFMTIVIGLVFFGLTMVPISMPLFGVSYLFGAALGQRLGNRLLRSSGTWLSSTGDSHFRIIGRLYETRPLLAQSCLDLPQPYLCHLTSTCGNGMLLRKGVMGLGPTTRATAWIIIPTIKITVLVYPPKMKSTLFEMVSTINQITSPTSAMTARSMVMVVLIYSTVYCQDLLRMVPGDDMYVVHHLLLANVVLRLHYVCINYINEFTRLVFSLVMLNQDTSRYVTLRYANTSSLRT